VRINVSSGTKVALTSEVIRDPPSVKEIILKRLNTYKKEHEHIICEESKQ
jgi:hypothetical protein